MKVKKKERKRETEKWENLWEWREDKRIGEAKLENQKETERKRETEIGSKMVWKTSPDNPIHHSNAKYN